MCIQQITQRIITPVSSMYVCEDFTCFVMSTALSKRGIGMALLGIYFPLSQSTMDVYVILYHCILNIRVIGNALKLRLTVYYTSH